MPCDAGWTRAPRSTLGGTPFRECRCAANDGAADAGARLVRSADCEIIRSSRSVILSDFSAERRDGHKNVLF
jgi:hypothetical protein